MTISFVASSQDFEASGTSVSPALPTGWAPGDVCIATCTRDALDNNGSAWTGPAGWALVGDWLGTIGRDVRSAIFIRVLQSGDSGPQFDTNSSADMCTGQLHAFRGADNFTPEDASVQRAEFLNDTTPINPSITTVTAALVFIAQMGSHDDISAAGAPSSFTLHGSMIGATHNQCAQIVATKQATTIGSQVPGAWTHTSSPTNVMDGNVVTMAIRSGRFRSANRRRMSP